jgi:flagellin-like hook-associated protein FlgL
MASESSATTDEKASYQNEFNNLALSNQSMVQNTYYQKKALLNTDPAGTPIVDITINPDDAAPGTITINPGFAIDSTVLGDLATSTTDNLTDAPAGALASAQADVTAAQADIASFIGTIAGYRGILQSQSNVTDSIVQNAQSASTLISGIDEADTLTTYTAQDIQKQAAIAMMAQANHSSRSILMLFGINQS